MSRQREDLGSSDWVESPKRTWHRLGWSVQQGAHGHWEAREPGKAIKCASFCLLSDSKSWVDKQIAIAISGDGEAA